MRANAGASITLKGRSVSRLDTNRGTVLSTFRMARSMFDTGILCQLRFFAPELLFLQHVG